MSEIKIPRIVEDVTVLSGDEPGVHFDKETNTYYMHPDCLKRAYQELRKCLSGEEGK